MQDLLNQVAAIAALRKEATPGPWVQWVEHPSVYAGPADENEPWTIRGVRVQIAECRIDQDSDLMSDFEEKKGPYDGDANAAFIAAVGGLDFEAVAAALGTNPALLADRLPDAFTNAIGTLEHLGREGVAEHLQAVAKIWQAKLADVKALPSALNEDLSFILGRPNFWCGRYAPALRVLGYQIPDHAEEEQATVINWLLQHYLADPINWRELVAADLKKAEDSVSKPTVEGAQVDDTQL